MTVRRASGRGTKSDGLTVEPRPPWDTPARIAVIDDEPSSLGLAYRALSQSGFEVTLIGDAQAGLEVLGRERFDVALIDLWMPQLHGLDLLRRLRSTEAERAHDLPELIMMTAGPSVEAAVEAMKLGARDFLTKPLDQIEQLVATVRKAAGRRDPGGLTASRDRGLPAPADDPPLAGSPSPDVFAAARSLLVFERLVGRSMAMRRVFELIERAAPARATVLIQGESGTGKELVARAIHARSQRAGRPFVTVNSAAIPEPLLESELFGHVKGAFTGAVADRRGLFEEAHQGTLFLDEIGEMPLPLQAKLLRVLQEREIRRVGGSEPIRIDVRVVAATHVDLAKAVTQGTFREDLFYRLNVVRIDVPPLRERREDIRPLVEHFVRKLSSASGRPFRGIRPDALRALEDGSWPGNVRELENVIERALVLGQGPYLELADLPATGEPGSSNDVAPAPAAIDPGSESAAAEVLPFAQAKLEAVASFERHYLEELLRRFGGNVYAAARVAHLDRSNFKRLLRRAGVTPRSDAPIRRH